MEQIEVKYENGRVDYEKWMDPSTGMVYTKHFGYEEDGELRSICWKDSNGIVMNPYGPSYIWYNANPCDYIPLILAYPDGNTRIETYEVGDETKRIDIWVDDKLYCSQRYYLDRKGRSFEAAETLNANAF